MAEQLPPGWISQWDENYQRPLYIQPATGHTQWEPPTEAAPQIQQEAHSDPHAPPSTHAKRRQYAAGQSQAYTGATDLPPMQAPTYVDPAASAGPALFTPGIDQSQMQSQQYYAQAAPTPAQPAYGQPQPGYGQQMNQMADQFAQMGVGGQKGYAVHTVNLIGTYLDPQELSYPPPEIRLPPGACISQSPLANADPSYMRCTVNAIPATNALLNKSKLPLALILTPNRSVRATDNDPEVPVVADTVIARCRRCRTYINPYVQFIDGGNRWKCCMCSMSNEVPQLFDWDQARNQPADRWARYELNHSVVEFIAPTEYMVRPPQPPVYTFLIDVSHSAVQSGMVATAARAILESLDRIPNADDRTKVAVIGFDVALHFFSVVPDSTDVTMLVVSDLEDVFLPKPTDLLINLKEARVGLEALLGRLNDMFQESHAIGSAMGPALQAAYKLTHTIGGKIMVLSSTLPTLGEGALKPREDPKLLGTAKESSLLQPASSFYKTFAIDCSRAQISVDMFLFSNAYTDVASLSCLPHYTSGQTFFYPAFNASRAEDALKFAHEFGEVLGSPIGLEAVMRVRASRGLRMSQFHGNFFVRSTDLLALPAVPLDQSYAIEVQIEENLTAPFVVMQTAVLHTTSFGERRIRVVTLALPTTSNVSELYASADQVAIATYLANKAVEKTLSSKLEDARDAVTNKLIDILGTYKSTMTAAGSGASAQLSVSDNLKFLPLLCLGLLKHVGLRQSAQIPPDLRAYAQALLTTLPSQQLMAYIHPAFYALHNMPPECGTVGEHGIIMPPTMSLTSERFERHGLYLIEDGQNMFLWVGRDAVPQLVADVFDLPNYEALRAGKQTMPTLDNDFSQRINAVIAKTRALRRGPYWPHLYVVKEDGEPALRMWALSMLIQDRMDQTPSYAQYLSSVKDKDQEFFEMFDLSPQGFPWTETRREMIIRRREDEMGGDLFFDELLKLAGIDAHAVYPPRDVPTFHHLVNSILDTAWDDFQQSCLVYYLLKHWDDGREKPFAQSKQLPPQFMFVSDAYYLLDADQAEEAVPYLCDSRVLHEFTSKIMLTLSSIPEPSIASRCLLRFVRVAKPTLASQDDLDIYVNALCYSSITDAWLYQRSLQEGDERERHIHRIITFCFHPKPRPEPLKTLLSFPFTTYEDRIVKAMALSPPEILSDASVAIFQNMIHVRLIHSGHYSEAIQLDRQFANAGTATGPAVKEAAARRKETLEELMGVIPVVQRRVLEMGIEEQEAEARKGKGPLIHGYANGQTNGDLATSWEHVNGSNSMMLDSTAQSPPRNTSVQPSSSSMTPLTASAAFRQAGSNAAVLKAFVHTSRLEGSPYAKSGSSTPIAAINLNAGNSSVRSPFARGMSFQRPGSQAAGSPVSSRLPRASLGSYPVRSATSTPVSTLAPPTFSSGTKPITRPAFNVSSGSASKLSTSRTLGPSTSDNAIPKPFVNPLSNATVKGPSSSERRVTPIKRPFSSSGGPGDRSMQSISAYDDSIRSWNGIPAPEQQDTEMDYDDGLDEDFVVQPAYSRPRYNPPEDISEHGDQHEDHEDHEEYGGHEQEDAQGQEQEQDYEHDTEQEDEGEEEEHAEEPEFQPEPEPTPEPEPRPPRNATRKPKDAPAISKVSSGTRLPGAFPSSPRASRTSFPPVEEQESPKKPSGRRSTRGRVSRAGSVAATDDGEDEPKPRRSSRLSHVPELSPPPQSPPRATKLSARKSKSGITKSATTSRVKTRRQREVIPEEA
ncbi:protein transporter SEC24 [Rhizoctonia solani AG-3 Rhs1AP]|uniref:Protein transporter SEC24 n=1 Tax=Rhizoctonia solani AG-3 Rhs1AP TaxID=1086054 RepID=X8IVI3_9AGAM|nr:protein transporter SEC24 [Rhizoctonia solani AG-3 Rhs1AP]